VRALHEASAYDEEAARVWREFNQPVIAAFVAQAHRHIAAGRIPAGLDVEPAVRALVGMNLYCFFDQVVGNPDVDVDTVVSSLLTVWARVFLLDDPPVRST
jgi:hypothetical protein